jgi:DNA polymerase delta subunit 1
MKNILEKRQNSYNITANSLYGQCGGTVSSFYEPDIAASTTASGRMMIMYARDMAETIYGGNRRVPTKDEGDVITDAKYVYGDTDSVFFSFNLRDAATDEPIYGKRALKITIELSQELTRLCTMWLKAPMEFAYEKTMFPFAIASKKRYAGMLYEKNIYKCYMKVMGLAIKRRDSCNYTKEVFGVMLDRIMDRDYTGAVQSIKQYLQMLVAGNVPKSKLTITKALRGHYANPQTIAHKVLADRIGARDPGNRPKPGDRMKFIHVVVPEKKGVKLLQGDKIETVEYMMAKNIPIDYTYYVTNQILKPISQIMALGIQQILTQGDARAYEHYIDQLEKRCVPLTEANLILYNAAREKYCMELVKKYLFAAVLQEIFRRSNHLAPITSFFHTSNKIK